MSTLSGSMLSAAQYTQELRRLISKGKASLAKEVLTLPRASAHRCRSSVAEIGWNPDCPSTPPRTGSHSGSLTPLRTPATRSGTMSTGRSGEVPIRPVTGMHPPHWEGWGCGRHPPSLCTAPEWQRPVPGPKWQLRRENWNGERCFFSSVPEGRLPPGYFTKHAVLHSSLAGPNTNSATYEQEHRSGAYEASTEVQERDHRGVPVGSQDWKLQGTKTNSWPNWWGRSHHKGSSSHNLGDEAAYMPPSRQGVCELPDMRRTFHRGTSMSAFTQENSAPGISNSKMLRSAVNEIKR